MSYGSATEKRLIDSDGAPLDRIVGFETEYACNYIKPNDPKLITEDMEQVGVNVAYVAGQLGGFKGDGERTYLDINHPEYCTAEDINFLDAAYRVIHGHIRMAKLVQRAAQIVALRAADKTYLLNFDFDPNKIELIANTTAYNPKGKNPSWGRHESLLTTRALLPRYFIDPLSAVRSTRVVWSGSGGIVKTDDTNDYKFELSEKAQYIQSTYGGGTTSNRSLVNSRDEPLADEEKFRRIHNIVGESNISPFAMALCPASDSIVLRACELGITFNDLVPLNPVEAIHKISLDPSLKARISLRGGKFVTGIDHQQAIAERAFNAASKADYITDQEAAWAAEWIDVLDDLKRDPSSCANRVDWVMKQKLINRELAGKAKSEDGKKESRTTVAWQKSADYHRIMPKEGIGMKILREGAFKFSPTAEQIDKGLNLPPTRAKVRAELVSFLERVGIDYAGDWQTIETKGTTVELPDPYATFSEDVDRLMAELKP